MGKSRFSRCAFGIGFLLVVAAARQDDALTPAMKLEVVSLQRRDQDLRATLRGETESKENAVLLVSLLPQLYQLAGDGKSLVLVSSPMGAVSCRAQIQKGSFTAVLQPSRLHEQEIRVLLLSPSGNALPRRQAVFLFDPGSARETQRKELALFTEHFKSVGELISEAEPYAQSKQPVSKEFLKRLRAVEEKVQHWAQITDLNAACSVLAGVLAELSNRVPRETQAASGEDSRYARKPENAVFNVEALKEKLRSAEEIALRESLLRVLAPLAGLVDPTSRPAEWDRNRKEARATVKLLHDLLSSLQSGTLSDAARAYAPAQEAALLLSDSEKARRGLPDPPGTPDPDALEKLKDLADRLNTLHDAILRS